MTREEALEIVKASFGWRGLSGVHPATGEADIEIYDTQRGTILRAHQIINMNVGSPETGWEAIRRRRAQSSEDGQRPGAVEYVGKGEIVRDENGNITNVVVNEGPTPGKATATSN